MMQQTFEGLYDDIGRNISHLRQIEQRAAKQRAILEQALIDLKETGDPPAGKIPRLLPEPTEAEGNVRKPGHNRRVIVSTLREFGPMRVIDVARHASATGLIQSPKGAKGVYSIVQTVIYRNRKTTFQKRGKSWGLHDHLLNQANKQQPLLADAPNDPTIGAESDGG